MIELVSVEAGGESGGAGGAFQVSEWGDDGIRNLSATLESFYKSFPPSVSFVNTQVLVEQTF